MGEMADIILDGANARPRALEGVGFVFEYDEVGPALHSMLSRRSSATAELRRS
jgi:NAD dependent epimerase/dehydratase family enzyme